MLLPVGSALVEGKRSLKTPVSVAGDEDGVGGFSFSGVGTVVEVRVGSDMGSLGVSAVSCGSLGVSSMYDGRDLASASSLVGRGGKRESGAPSGVGSAMVWVTANGDNSWLSIDDGLGKRRPRSTVPSRIMKCDSFSGESTTFDR